MLYKRKYQDYQHYLCHQGEKLSKNIEHFQEISIEKFENFREILRDISPKIPGGKVLCLGARLGEEVRAFRDWGHADAVGIDINPGPNNEYVIEGDFHNIPFENAVFDGVYCNCLDHAWDLRAVSQETARVLKPNGILVLDVPFAQPYKKRDYRKRVKKENKYEAMLWDSINDVIGKLQEFKEVYDRIPSSSHRIIIFMQKN
jgi:SAM-dependent methyltransferase